MDETVEVRCCCVPKKLLGWVRIPPNHPNGQAVQFALRPVSLSLEGAQFITLPMKKIVMHHGDAGHWALQSNETPIEELRRIRTWRENMESV